MANTDMTDLKSGVLASVSFTVSTARLLEALVDRLEGRFSFALAVSDGDALLLEAAALECVRAACPDYRGDYAVPLVEMNGQRALVSHGKYPPVMKTAEGVSIPTVAPGSTVRFRVTLKAWMSGDGPRVYAFPSRIDVLASAPVQLDLLAQPKPKSRLRTKPTKAEKDALLRRLMQEKAAAAAIRKQRAQAQAATPAPKPKRRSSARKPRVTGASNVIAFPLARVRRPT